VIARVDGEVETAIGRHPAGPTFAEEPLADRVQYGIGLGRRG
jgi:hypothetical protein